MRRFLITLILLSFPLFISAEENLQTICQLDKIEQSCKISSNTDCRKLLEKCEAYYQSESDKISKDLSKTEAEKKTLQNKVNSLSQKIKNLDYQISQSNLIIKDLRIQIQDTTSSIDKTAIKIEDVKKRLSNILRSLSQEDQKPLIEVLFTEEKLSGFFDNMVDLEILNKRNKDLLQEIKVLKTNLEEQKGSLDEEKGGLESMVKIQTLQKQENQKVKTEQEGYLKITEKQYQDQLKQKEEAAKMASEIRSRIFEIIGVPKAPTFGEAYEIAKYVSGITGVRPALLLAVITQESNLGKNVGQCFLTNETTGQGKKISTNEIKANTMNPTRDVPKFIEITKELGRDPFNTPISCPMSFGWGGAMGPAQFIPSTWYAYKDRIKSAIGKPGDPWNINNAFLAAALYLGDYGAKSQTENQEWRAAMIYFAGTVNTKYRFYGDSVIKIAKQYEEDIKKIGNGL